MSKLPTFAFVHIEKTAGSSLHQLLLESFPKYLSVHPGYLPKEARANYLFFPAQLRVLMRLYGVCGFGGHKVRSYLNYEAVVGHNIAYFTFLREPASRYISQYQYLVTKRGLKIDFDEFLSLEGPRNLQVKRLCGHGSVSDGWTELKKYKFVGFLENFMMDLRLLSYHVFENRLHVRKIMRNSITRPILPSFDEMPISWKRKIIENNRLDKELYERAKSELYPAFQVPEGLLPSVEPSFSRSSFVGRFEIAAKGIRRYGLEPLSYALSKVF